MLLDGIPEIIVFGFLVIKLCRLDKHALHTKHHRLAYRLRGVLWMEYQKCGIICSVEFDLLSGDRCHKLIDHDGKTDRRRILSKVAEQLVVSSTLYDRLPGSVGIPGENDAGIILVVA